MKQIAIKSFLFLSIFLLGGLGGVFFERVVIPQLSATDALKHATWLRPFLDRTVVINKTEQIIVREDDTIEKIVSQPATTVVNIVAKPVDGSNAPRGNVKTSGAVEISTGTLLTNDGVVVSYREHDPLREGERVYSVLLSDGLTYEARYLGWDTFTNLLFLKVDANNLPAIAFANPADARVGKKLVAIGNASEEYQTRFAVGILNNINKTFNLSGKSVASTEKWEGVFEMDLSNAREFVGGPAVEWNGEMLGIVGTLAIDNHDQIFLLPVNAVRESFDRVLSGSLSTRPDFGAYYVPVTKAYALAHDLRRDRGALIYSPSGKTGLALLSGSPAERSGLRVGDIVIAVSGKEINLAHPFSVALGRLSSGDTATLLIDRGGEELTLPVRW